MKAIGGSTLPAACAFERSPSARFGSRLDPLSVLACPLTTRSWLRWRKARTSRASAPPVRRTWRCVSTYLPAGPP